MVSHEKMRAEVTASAKAPTRKPRVFKERKKTEARAE